MELIKNETLLKQSNSGGKQSKQEIFWGCKRIEHTSVPRYDEHNCVNQGGHAPGATARVKGPFQERLHAHTRMLPKLIRTELQYSDNNQTRLWNVTFLFTL